MRRGIGLDAFDDDIDTGAASRRDRLAPDTSDDEQRHRWAAEDERELRALYARAGVMPRVR